MNPNYLNDRIMLAFLLNLEGEIDWQNWINSAGQEGLEYGIRLLKTARARVLAQLDEPEENHKEELDLTQANQLINRIKEEL